MNELTMTLASHIGTPLYEQIYLHLKEDIVTGKLAFHEKLPSTRALAKHLEVSRSTVDLAYGQLLSEGYIESEPCRGYYVAQIEGLYRLREDLQEKAVEHRPEKEVFRYDFSPNGVDLGSFPYNAWRKLSREILMDDQVELFRLGDVQGEYSFRKVICDYLYQARGVDCKPHQIVVGAGSDYLLLMLCSILGRNHVVAVENPAYRQAYRLFQGQEYPVMPVEMDTNGMRTDLLQETEADIAYVTPSHQYPTGIVMPLKRRMELLAWANAQKGRYIIEDDYDSEFRYKGKPIPALQGNDANGKVIYLGTFSKSIAPAIRMSYMVLPEELVTVYREKCGFLSSTVSKVDQLIVQHFIEKGYYERHLNKTRSLYKGRHDVLIRELQSLKRGCRISGEYAGVHLLLTFPAGVSEEVLIRKAAQAGVKVYGMSDYCIGEKSENATILLGYANLSENEIKEAVQILQEAWSEELPV